MKLSDSEVNHLRRLLAWMRTEYCLDDDMQRGCLSAVKSMMDSGAISPEQAVDAINKRAEQVKQVPQYMRQGIKMLTAALRAHDGVKGALVDADVRDVQYIGQEGKT